MKEIFRDVKDYEGLYEVSNLGNVKSLSRFRKGKNGSTVTVKEKILKQSFDGAGYLAVVLCENGNRANKRVHKLVAVAFLNHAKTDYEIVVDHVDNDKLNNNLNNLQLISVRENSSKDRRRKYSKFIGISYNKSLDSWKGEIQVKGNRRFTKTVKSEEEAYKLYKVMLNELNLVNYNEI